MNSITSTRKIITGLTGLVAFGLTALAATAAFNASALELFAFAAAGLTLLIGVNDYAPRPGYAAAAAPVRARRHERMPLAA